MIALEYTPDQIAISEAWNSYSNEGMVGELEDKTNFPFKNKRSPCHHAPIFPILCVSRWVVVGEP